MIFQFQTGDVTFFNDDRAYFEKRFTPLKKYMGDVSNKEVTDTITTEIKLQKLKQHSGDRFQAIASITCKNLGTLRAEVDADTIKKLADLLHDNLKTQIRRSREKSLGK
jgi:ribosome-associated translation inhibitor RaiA